MNNKIINYIFIGFFAYFLLTINVNAYTYGCSAYASKGAAACNAATAGGYKCKWDGNKKGGARCYVSKTPADSEIPKITSCDQLKAPEVCSNSIVDGRSCIWRQNACHDTADTGSGETIIKDEKPKTENSNKKDDKFQYLSPIHLGKLSCNTVFKNNDGTYNNFYYLFWNVLKIMKYAAIGLTLGLSLMDFIKVISSGDKDELKKATNRSIKRLIIGVIIFFVPTLLNFVLNIIGDYTTCNLL